MDLRRSPRHSHADEAHTRRSPRHHHTGDNRRRRSPPPVHRSKTKHSPPPKKPSLFLADYKHTLGLFELRLLIQRLEAAYTGSERRVRELERESKDIRALNTTLTQDITAANQRITELNNTNATLAQDAIAARAQARDFAAAAGTVCTPEPATAEALQAKLSSLREQNQSLAHSNATAQQ